MSYRLYKFLKVLEKAFDNFIETLFYVPAWLYKNSEWFYKFIKSSENKSYERSKKKYLSKKVFRCLEHNHSCTIFRGMDDEYGHFDTHDISFDILFSDEKWINKNKLKVEKTTYYEYIEKHMPERLYLVGSHEKEKEVYIVSR